MSYPPMRLEERSPKTDQDDEISLRATDEKAFDKIRHFSQHSRPLSAKVIEKRKSVSPKRKQARPISAKRSIINAAPKILDQETQLLSRIRPTNIQIDKERLYDENMALKIENNTFRAENIKIKTRLSQIEKDNTKKNELIKELSNKEKSPTHINIRIVGSLKQTIKDLKSELKKKDEEIQKFRKSMKITKIGELEVEIKTYVDECVRLRQGMEDLIRKKAQEFSVFSSPEEFKLKDSIIIGLRKEKNDLASSLSLLQEENYKYKERLLDFERTRKRPGKKEANTGLKTEIQRLKAIIDENTKDYKDKEISYMNEITQHKKDYEKMKTKFLNEEMKNKELNLSIEKLKNDIQNIKTPIVKTPIIPITPEQNIKPLASSDLYNKINKIVTMKKIRLTDFIKLIDKNCSGYCEIEDFIKVFKDFGQEILKNDIEGVCFLHNGKKVVFLKMVEEGYENMEFNQEENYDDEGFEDEKAQEKLLFVKEIENIPNFSLENTLGEKMVKLVSFDDVSGYFKHVAYSMQLNRLPKDELCKLLFDVNFPSYKKLSKEELAKCFKNPPFVFAQKYNIESFCLFLIQPEEEFIEENKLPQLSATMTYILKKLNDNLPEWNIFTAEEENQFDELLYQLIQEHKNALKSNCKVFDKDKKKIIPFNDFITALKNTNISLEARPLDYLLLLFYSHENEIDSVPYKNFIEAYCEPSSAHIQAEADYEKLEAIKQGLFLIAQAMIKSKITVKEAFQNDHGLIYPENFISGLEYLGLKYIENEIVLLILEELQYEKESKNCILLEEFEKIMESLGVGYKKPKRSIRSISSKESSKKKIPELENYDYSEELPEKYGISEVSPFESGSNIDPQRSFTKLELERVNDKSSSVCTESVEKLGFYEKSVATEDREVRISDLNKDITSSKNEITDEGVKEEGKNQDDEKSDRIFKEDEDENFDYSNDFEKKNNKKIEKARESSELLIIVDKSKEKHEFNMGLNEGKERKIKLESIGFSEKSAESSKRLSRNSSDKEIFKQKSIKIDDFVDKSEKSLISEKNSEKDLSSYREKDNKNIYSVDRMSYKDSQNYSEDSDNSSKNKGSHKSNISKSSSEKDDKKSLKFNNSSKLSEKSSEKSVSYREPLLKESMNSSLYSSQKEFQQSEDIKHKDFTAYSQKSEKDIKLSEMPSEKSLKLSSKLSEKSLKLSENPSEKSLKSYNKNINSTENLSDRSSKLNKNPSDKSIKLSEKSKKISEKSSQKSLGSSRQSIEEFLKNGKKSSEKIPILSKSSSQQSSKSIEISNDKHIENIPKSPEKSSESSRKSSKKSSSDNFKRKKSSKSSSSSSDKSSRKSSKKKSSESDSEKGAEEKNIGKEIIKNKGNENFVKSFEFSEESQGEKYEGDYDDNFDDSEKENTERKEETLEYEESKNENIPLNQMIFEVVQPEKPLFFEVDKINKNEEVKTNNFGENRFDSVRKNTENDDKLSDKSEDYTHHKIFDKPDETAYKNTDKESMSSKKASEEFRNYDGNTEKNEEILEKNSINSEKLNRHEDINTKNYEKNIEKSDENLEKSSEYSEASFENPENLSKSSQKSFDDFGRHDEITENNSKLYHEEETKKVENLNLPIADENHESSDYHLEKKYDNPNHYSDSEASDNQTNKITKNLENIEKLNESTGKVSINSEKQSKNSESQSEHIEKFSKTIENYEESSESKSEKSEKQLASPEKPEENISENKNFQDNLYKEINKLEKSSDDHSSSHSKKSSKSSIKHESSSSEKETPNDFYEESDNPKPLKINENLSKLSNNFEDSSENPHITNAEIKQEIEEDKYSDFEEKTSVFECIEDSMAEKRSDHEDKYITIPEQTYEESYNFSSENLSQKCHQSDNPVNTINDNEIKAENSPRNPNINQALIENLVIAEEDKDPQEIRETYEEPENVSSREEIMTISSSENPIEVSDNHELSEQIFSLSSIPKFGLEGKFSKLSDFEENLIEEKEEFLNLKDHNHVKGSGLSAEAKEHKGKLEDLEYYDEKFESGSEKSSRLIENPQRYTSEEVPMHDSKILDVSESNENKAHINPLLKSFAVKTIIEEIEKTDEKFESGSEKSSRLIENPQRYSSEEITTHDSKIAQVSESNENKAHINPLLKSFAVKTIIQETNKELEKFESNSEKSSRLNENPQSYPNEEVPIHDSKISQVSDIDTDKGHINPLLKSFAVKTIIQEANKELEKNDPATIVIENEIEN
ncbi:hypothetical protein SteCoe_6188 [Stentor coeruleus]|uniref:EF-hand domain-containing protein n=1 Tax=Stentor coeruleus TaxID=5963 RepID=A0A1R2CQL4_9CILI|nr:hypothetical protein SteCoe_6188 [Stentor coeruleus]